MYKNFHLPHTSYAVPARLPLSVAIPAKKLAPLDIPDPLAPTIFHEDWWLKITTRDNYACAEVSEHGRVVGRLPYMTVKRRGMKIVEQPPLTHALGPALIKNPGKATTGQLRAIEITQSLIQQLPPLSRAQFHCHRDVTDVTAFQAEGFMATVQFTREIAPQPVNVLWDSLRKKARNNILQAEGQFAIDSTVEPEEFVRLYTSNLEEKDCDNYLDMTICHTLLTEMLRRGRGCIYGTRDKDGNLSTAIVCTWDSAASYYLMCTLKPDAARGAASLLVWQAIKDAMGKGLIFDFDGFASEGAVRFSANFSASVMPRYIVTRDTVPMQIFQSLRSVLRPNNYFCI
jgi:hypothetical protein